MAICIATAAIRAGYNARYFKTSDLLYNMSMTMDDGAYLTECQKFLRFRLLLLDDFGKVGMTELEKSILFDLIEDRSTTRLVTIIVGQRPYNERHAFIDNPVIADDIMDRRSRDKYRVKLRGESLRKRDAALVDT